MPRKQARYSDLPPSKRTTAADAKPRAKKKEDDEEGKEVLAKRCRGNKLLLRLLLDASKRRCPQRASWDRGMAPVMGGREVKKEWGRVRNNAVALVYKVATSIDMETIITLFRTTQQHKHAFACMATAHITWTELTPARLASIIIGLLAWTTSTIKANSLTLFPTTHRHKYSTAQNDGLPRSLAEWAVHGHNFCLHPASLTCTFLPQRLPTERGTPAVASYCCCT
jgi:hypothetical protein